MLHGDRFVRHVLLDAVPALREGLRDDVYGALRVQPDVEVLRVEIEERARGRDAVIEVGVQLVLDRRDESGKS